MGALASSPPGLSSPLITGVVFMLFVSKFILSTSNCASSPPLLPGKFIFFEVTLLFQGWRTRSAPCESWREGQGLSVCVMRCPQTRMSGRPGKPQSCPFTPSPQSPFCRFDSPVCRHQMMAASSLPAPCRAPVHHFCEISQRWVVVRALTGSDLPAARVLLNLTFLANPGNLFLFLPVLFLAK